MSISPASLKRTRNGDAVEHSIKIHRNHLIRPPLPPLPSPPPPPNIPTSPLPPSPHSTQEEQIVSQYARAQSDDTDSDPDELIIDESSTADTSAPLVGAYNAAISGCRRVESVYTRLNTIDEGTYGVVHRAMNKETLEIVALKKMKYDRRSVGVPITALREMNILMIIQHPHIIHAREVVIGNTHSPQRHSIYLVMDYCEHDLKILYSRHSAPFRLSEIKRLLYQLLLAVQHCHRYRIVHRDIKMSNLLYNNQGQLKLCDFGLARYLPTPRFAMTGDTGTATGNTPMTTTTSTTTGQNKSGQMTPLVQTLWYRSPELLLGALEYDCAVDMWSVGCIMAELITGQPLLPGKGELDQIGIMFGLIGSPTVEEWPGLAALPHHTRYTIKPSPSKLRATFPRQSYTSTIPLSDIGFDLMTRLLTYNPEKRLTADGALRHPWFDEAPMMQSTAMMPTFPSYNEHSARKLVKQ